MKEGRNSHPLIPSLGFGLDQSGKDKLLEQKTLKFSEMRWDLISL